MTPLITWSILTGAGMILALIMIGFRNWGGWLVLAIESAAWMVYSAARGASVLVHIFNLLMIAISVYFAYRWGKRAMDDEEQQEATAVAAHE